MCEFTIRFAFFIAFYKEICLNRVREMEVQKHIFTFRCVFVHRDHDIL